MKKIIFLIVFVGLLAVILNDGGRLYVAKNRLRADTSTLTSWASNNAAGMNRSQVASQLVERAAADNVTVYQYGQDQNGMQIWTQTRVDGLWIVGTYKASLDGAPIRSSLGSPMIVRDYGAAQYR